MKPLSENTTTDEIARLNSRIAAMEQLLRVTEEAVISRSIQLEETLKDLSDARDVAVSASLSKSEFLANMSHEIRTPMNSIIGITELLLRSEQEPKQRELLQVIQEAGQSLLSILGDILDFSKIEAGKLQIELVDFSPVAAIEGAAELLSKPALDRNLSLLTFIDPQLPRMLVGDSVRLRQIMVNLIGNAVKFSQQGTVLVRADLLEHDRDSVKVKFSVADNGIGMTEEECQRLFQAFVQADGSTTRKFGGTGLGLCICKHLVEMMGGDIAVESVRGAGSLFHFSLPFAVSKKPVQPRTVHSVLKQKRLLVVDDQPAAREILASYLSSWGLRWSAAAGGSEALSEMEAAFSAADPYHIVLVDLIMPEMDGSEFLTRLQAMPAISAGVQAILITAYDKPGQGAEMLKQGFRSYLRKPIKQSQLLDCLATLVTESEPRESTVKKVSALTTSSPARKFDGSACILLVEDNKANQILAELQLQELGLNVHTAANGREALDACSRQYYDAILMDCQMPEMDGFETCRAVRWLETQSGHHTPIIAMTANAMKGDRDNCIAAGMDDYIAKPVAFEELLSVLQKWLPKKLLARTDLKPFLPEQEEDFAEFVGRMLNFFGTTAVEEMLETFESESRKSFEDISACFERNDAAGLKAAAHKLKGASATYRAHELAALSRQLEEGASAQDWRQMRGTYAQIQSTFEAVRQSIAAILEARADTERLPAANPDSAGA
jgi:two-component system, sensor histidine kinase and response regulator